MTGYFPTGEYKEIQAVYGDLVHSNNGVYLSGGVFDNRVCQKRSQILAVMPKRRYDAPNRRVWQ